MLEYKDENFIYIVFNCSNIFSYFPLLQDFTILGQFMVRSLMLVLFSLFYCKFHCTWMAPQVLSFQSQLVGQMCPHLISNTINIDTITTIFFIIIIIIVLKILITIKELMIIFFKN